MSVNRDRLDKAIVRYDVSLMSNTKWRMVFHSLAEHSLVFRIAYVRGHTYGSAQQLINPELHNEYIGDGCVIGGPLMYKDIFGLKIDRYEQLRDSSTGKAYKDEARSLRFLGELNVQGKFPVEITDKYIFIHGYK